MPPRVTLKQGRAKPFFFRHPWVLESAVARVEGDPADGDAVDLVSHEGAWVARGYFNSASRIRVRLFTWDADEALADELLARRVEDALAMRRQIGYDDPAGAARLVYGDADGLSGLIVDRFADVLTVQVNALAIGRRLEACLEPLRRLLSPRAVYLRCDPHVAAQEGLTLESGWLDGREPDGPVEFTEHGLTHRVDPTAGQKTGFYLDQRENRAAAARLLAGRRVLDVFCYTGAFALNAARGGAADVLGIDSSQRAVDAATEGAARNGLTGARFEVADALPTLDRLVARGERFGGVVLDPPKFAKSRGQVDAALRAYLHVNRRGLELLEPGGVLVTCSCSGAVSRDDFRSVLATAAVQARRPVQLLEERGASPDHPVSVTCLETDYLKCLVARVG